MGIEYTVLRCRAMLVKCLSESDYTTMGSVLTRIATVIILTSLVFWAVPAYSQDKISLRLPVYWSMSKHIDQEVAGYGGLLGIRVESKADFPINDNVYAFANPWYRLSGWVSEASVLGPYQATVLSEFEMRLGVSIHNTRVFGGFRTIHGSTIRDWLSEDTSGAAGNSKYAEELHESYELTLKGPMIGFGYSIKTVAENSGNCHFINISAYMMSIDYKSLRQNYYLFEIDYFPKGNGFCYIISFGKSSKSKLREFSFGIGRQFDL